MSRNRLAALLATILLGLTATPAAALGVAEGSLAAGDNVVSARETGKISVVKAAKSSPIIDEGIEGVGHVLVDADPDKQTITVGVKITPLGVDETVTLGMPGGGDEEAAPEPQDDAVVQDDATAAAAKADLVDQKGAMDAAPSASAGPAFAGVSPRASGQAAGGTGTGRSVRPAPVAPDADGNTAADIILADSNPVLRLLGVMMLAGTAGIWSFARRNGLA